MITFENLFEALRKEKFNQELQKLDKDFYEQVIKYLEEKTAILESQTSSDSIFSSEAKKTQLQIENAKKIIKETYEKRESKTISLALASSKALIKEIPQELLSEEKRLYQDVLEVLNNYRNGVLYNVLKKNKPSVKVKNEEAKELKTSQNEKDENRMIRFVKSVPKFVADDLSIYGPFEQEDISYLPKKTANLLIKKKRAEEIKVENS